MKRSPLLTTLLHVPLLIGAIVCALPMVWLVCASLKTGPDLFRYNFLPWDHLSHLTLDNFAKLFARDGFSHWLVNSIFLASTQTTIVVALSSLGGFALAKYQFRGQKSLTVIMLLTLLLPAQVLMPGVYELVHKLGWINSYAAILVPGAVSVFGMFLFRQAMKTVPDELLHAGRIDGCSELRLWWDICLPIIRPMIGAFTLMTFIGTWNGYLWPQIVLQDEAKYTLPMGLANMMSLPEFQTDYGILMAGTLLSILPVVILFFILQKDFIAGLSSGAVKG
ncbi:carbohydrate ABC transporter permease [soil metagenome]